MRYVDQTINQDGWTKWVFPRRQGYRMMCCDCGMVHEMQFRMRGRHIEFRARRLNRATAAARRAKREWWEPLRDALKGNPTKDHLR